MKKIMMTIVALFMLSACSTTPDLTKPRITLKDAKPPEWVLKSSGAFKNHDVKGFYGIGSANDIKNYSMQRMTADDRARNDLAKNFSFYTGSLLKDYMASTTALDFKNSNESNEEQHVESAIKTITSISLSGVIIIDHWENPYKNELFSLAKMNLEKFKENLDRHHELSKKLREYIKKRADNLHKELNIERKK